MDKKRVFTTGDLAAHFGVPIWAIRKCWERGLLPPAERVGNYRVVDASRLGMVEAAALRTGGYLSKEAS
jgi:DNA-binding transcriptional MerR regulator